MGDPRAISGTSQVSHVKQVSHTNDVLNISRPLKRETNVRKSKTETPARRQKFSEKINLFLKKNEKLIGKIMSKINNNKSNKEINIDNKLEIIDNYTERYGKNEIIKIINSLELRDRNYKIIDFDSSDDFIKSLKEYFRENSGDIEKVMDYIFEEFLIMRTNSSGSDHIPGPKTGLRRAAA